MTPRFSCSDGVSCRSLVFTSFLLEPCLNKKITGAEPSCIYEMASSDVGLFVEFDRGVTFAPEPSSAFLSSFRSLIDGYQTEGLDFDILLAPLIAPEEDVESGGEAVAFVSAEVSEPMRFLFHLIGASAFGHEENLARGDGEA